ncbi:MAG: hypothetical protein OXI60_00960 [Acidiferrobacterales bacterium]|nr:hypothetical protein [Acidiferrobacterales bacterium]
MSVNRIQHAKYDFRNLWGAQELVWISQYDGLEYFRLTALGAYCLGLEDSYQHQSESSTPISVFSDSRIQVAKPLSASERLTLERFANEEAENTWRLARDKILLSVENGADVNDLRDFLISRDDQPLPEKVEGFLRSSEQNARALSVRGSAILIECISEEVAADIASNRHTQKLCMRSGEKHLSVPIKSEKTFRKVVRQLGYGMHHSK